MDGLAAIIIVAVIFVGMPWVILHYVTKWKSAASLTGEDEALLDQLYDTARRLEERLRTVERILAADHPDYRPLGGHQTDYRPIEGGEDGAASSRIEGRH